MKNSLPRLEGTSKGDTAAIRQHQAYAQGAFVLDSNTSKGVDTSQTKGKKTGCTILPGKNSK